MNRKSPHGLRRRMLIWIMGIVSTVLATMLICVFILSSHIARGQMHLRARHHSVEVAQALKLGTFMHSAVTVGHMLRLAFEEHADEKFPPDKAVLNEHISDVLKLFPNIVGCGYFFEPRSVDPAVESLWYYGYRTGEKIALDDPDDNYLSEAWYQDGMHKSQPSWTAPYWDPSASNELVVTFRVPVDRGGKRIGMVAVDVSITSIKQQLEAIQMPRSATYFLLGPDGHFLASPDASLEEGDVSLETLNPALSETILRDRSGTAVEKSPLTGEQSWISFYPVSETSLTLVFVTPMLDLLAPVRTLQQLLLASGGLGLLFLFIATRFIARSISRPIEELTETVRTVSDGHLDARFEGRLADDEIGELATAFNQMPADLRRYLHESAAAAASKARLDRDLHISREIQMGLLPKTFPAFPGRADFELHAIMEPAREVGGDFYDYFLLSENRLCFVIGDVSDKGIPAALLMAVTKTMIDATIRQCGDPAHAACIVNRTLNEHNDAVMFVTVFLGILDCATGQVVYCNAGHNLPLIRRADGTVETVPSTEGAALGALPDIPFENASMTLGNGDALLLYTDGVTEAMNGESRLYHLKRLTHLMAAEGHLPVEKLTEAVFLDVKAHAADAPQSDDIAILAIRRHANSSPLAEASA